MSHKKSHKEAPSDALTGLRSRIDALDDQIIELLSARASVAQEVGRVKAASQQRAYAPERERQLLDRIAAKNRGPLSESSLRLIYKEIISASLALESPLQVVYLGPEATFTHEATKRHFGLSARLEPKSSIGEVFSDVERGRAEFGVVPIENSTEGVVNNTLDGFMSTDLSICAEVILPISHTLLSREGSIRNIAKIYSHPQALAQCRQWLTAHLPNVTLLETASTARAAQLAAEDPTAAAIASDLAASLYELKPVARHLEDTRGNVTRFVVIGDPSTAPAPSGADRTSVMFALKDEAGILFRALAPFAERDINMSRIESRPSRRKAWEYLFFIDIDGHRQEPKIAEAIAALGKTCEIVRVLGSYPVSRFEGRARK